MAFEYLGKILSYFLAIDTVVSGNEFLKDNWNKNRTMLYQCKNNASEFNMTEEQVKKLDKLMKKLNAPIFENTCYTQSLKIILSKSGEMSPSGAGVKPLNQCSVFLHHFKSYISSKIKKIYNNLNTLTESYEPIQLFHYLSLFGLYLRLFGANADKEVLKQVWHCQKKYLQFQY